MILPMCHTFATKNNHTENPENYRLITYMLTSYKFLTSILIKGIYCHLEEHNIWPIEEKIIWDPMAAKISYFEIECYLKNTRTKHIVPHG